MSQTHFPTIQNHTFNQQTRACVMGTDLHAFLEVETPFHKWVLRRIEMLGLEQNQDFTTDKTVRQGILNRSFTQYLFTIEAAKHISMAERNDKGRQAREYFIGIENEAKQVIPHLQNQLKQERQDKQNLIQALLDSNPVLAKIHRYHQLGLNQTEIAKLCDLSTETIRKHQYQLVELHLVDAPKPAIEAKRFTMAELNDMMERRNRGQSYRVIGLAHQCSADTVSRRIKAALGASHGK